MIGAVVGAGLGQAIGGDTKGTLIGAGIGAALGGIAGNQIGAYMDRQEQALRDAMAQSEAVNIQRTQDVLTATFKGDVFFVHAGNANRSRVARAARECGCGSGPRRSERRAEAVKNAVTQRGVDPRRMQSVGYGESQPISSSDAMNRRVSIVITPIQQG